MGERFFSSSTYNSLMKKMKKRANEAADRYHTLATQEAPLSHTAGSCGYGTEHDYFVAGPKPLRCFFHALLRRQRKRLLKNLMKT